MVETDQRAQLIAVGERLAAAGLVRESEGNLSIRLGDSRCVVTSTGSDLGRLDPSQLVEVPIEATTIPFWRELGGPAPPRALPAPAGCRRDRPRASAAVAAAGCGRQASGVEAARRSRQDAWLSGCGALSRGGYPGSRPGDGGCAEICQGMCASKTWGRDRRTVVDGGFCPHAGPRTRRLADRDAELRDGPTAAFP